MYDRPECLPSKDPTCLILSGGGSRIVATVGALCRLYDQYPIILHKVHKFVGTSAGAILSLLLCCGYTIPELHLMLDDLDMAALVKIDFGFLFQSNVLGLDDGRGYLIWVAERMKAKGISPDITLAGLYKTTGKILVAITTDVNTKSVFSLSHENEPDFSALLAVRASIGIPILFKPVIYKHRCLVDGGVLCPFAFDLFVSIIDDSEVIFGINLEEPNIDHAPSSTTETVTPKNMYEMFCVCLSIMAPSSWKERQQQVLSEQKRHAVLNIPLRKFYSIIAASRDQQDELFEDGWSAASSSSERPINVEVIGRSVVSK